MAAHCEASGDLSLRLGLGPEVRDPLQQAFERWDGKGSPAKLAGPEIARIMRIVHVANDVEALHPFLWAGILLYLVAQIRHWSVPPEGIEPSTPGLGT